MKKFTFFAMFMCLMMASFAQGPSKCAPGDSMAAKCKGFGMQVD